MHQREAAVEQIRIAFREAPFPGDRFLQGSFDGCEPYDEVSAFHGRAEWAALDPEFLDAHHAALSFLSEAGFRFFVPAYLVADLQDRLRTADPLFHLTHGWFVSSVEHAVGGRVFVRHTGPHVLVNPRRYGAMTWADHARHRLSVFTREEAQAVVAYLRCRRASAQLDDERAQVDQALDAYWLERARTAPPAEGVARHQRDEAAYADTVAAHVAHATDAAAAEPGLDAAPDTGR